MIETNLIIAGWLQMFLGVSHLAFPKYFDWKNGLSGLNLLNRQIFYVHTFFIGLVVFMVGLLSASSSEELIQTSFGRRIAAGICIFWLIRLIVQFFGYSSVLWKGKRFETIMHLVFSLLWTYFVVSFGLAAVG